MKNLHTTCRRGEVKIKQTFLLMFLLTTTTMLFATDYAWTGNSNYTWSNSANWTPTGIPTLSSNVTIGTVVSGRYPTISNGSCNNITISGNATLNFNLSSSYLNVYGNFINNTSSASILGTQGTVYFKGNTNTSIESTNGGTSTTFNYLVVDKSSTTEVSVASGYTATIVYSLLASVGNFDASNGSLILYADNVNMTVAYIDGTGGGSVTGGNVTVEQLVTDCTCSGGITYHALCNPVQSATPASMGAFASPNPVIYNSSYDYPTGTPMPTFYWYL